MNDEAVNLVFKWLIFCFIAVALFGVLLSTCDAEAKAADQIMGDR